MNRLLYNVSKIFKQCTFRSYSHKKTIKENFKPPWNVLFFGTDDFSLASLKLLYLEYQKGILIKKFEVVTSVRGKTNPVYNFAIQEKLSIHKWPVELKGSNFDLGVVVSFGHLIPEDIINQFPLGILNIHASLLPRWRGAAPIIHAIAYGDKTTGITIMRIKPKQFDIGEIIAQKAVEITSDTKLPELHNKLANVGATLLMETIEHLLDNLEKAKEQPQNGVTYAPKIKSQMARVNWQNQSAQDVYNLYRALTGIYSLKTTWNETPIKLLTIVPCNKTTNKIIPGSVIYNKNSKLLEVQCADGNWIGVATIGVHGKKVMTAKDFNNGYLKKVHLLLQTFK